MSLLTALDELKLLASHDNLPISLDSLSTPSTQYKWRIDPPIIPQDTSKFVAWSNECTVAILECLIIQGGIEAYVGDGVGCVQQLVAAVAKKHYEAGYAAGHAASRDETL